MATTQGFFDADGHVYELEYQIIEYLDPPFRGKKELLRQPLINSGDGWHRIALGIGRGQGGPTYRTKRSNESSAITRAASTESLRLTDNPCQQRRRSCE